MKQQKINDYDSVDTDGYNANINMPVIQEPAPRRIEDILYQFTSKKINLQPDFQRQFIWPKKKQKELIKSLYTGVPLPMFYFAETTKGREEVVDGQQRLTTIFGFLRPKSIDNKIQTKVIKNIKIVEGGKIISAKRIKDCIKKKKIYCVGISKAGINLKYEIFRTLNQGAVQLRPQEIRNCIFVNEMPEFNKLLKDMGRELRKITGLKFERMMGEELVFRFFVINKYGYDKDVTHLMDNYSNIKNDFSVKEITKQRKKYKEFLRRLKYIFGKEDVRNCFQVLEKKAKYPKINKWPLYVFSKRINQGLYHLLSYYIPRFSMHQINKNNIAKIKQGYLSILKRKAFIKVITGAGTNSPKNIKKSKIYFDKYFIKPFIGDWADKQKHNISKEEKETIFRTVPYCYLCYGKLPRKYNSKKIHAEHIESFGKGNPSKYKNILLAHDACNLSKLSTPFEEYFDTQKSILRRKRNRNRIDEYLSCLSEWNKAYPLKKYRLIRRYALRDKKALV